MWVRHCVCVHETLCVSEHTTHLLKACTCRAMLAAMKSDTPSGVAPKT